MKLFLVCNNDGYVMKVVTAKSFEESYRNTIGLNSGEILVELDEQTIAEIKNLTQEVKTPHKCPYCEAEMQDTTEYGYHYKCLNCGLLTIESMLKSR